MIVFPLILLASATTPAASSEPVKCDAKPFTLSKPATPAKGGSAKGAQAKADPPKPILKPSCGHPDHGKPGHKH